MAKSPPKRRSRPAVPRRPWYGPDKLRAAFMAGYGASSAEIAKAVGGTTAARVRSMLREAGIPLVGQAGRAMLLLRWKTSDRERLNAAADQLERDPVELAALLLRKALDEKLEEQIDPLDVIG